MECYAIESSHGNLQKQALWSNSVVKNLAQVQNGDYVVTYQPF